jgi:hypothetical protein
MPLTQKSAEKLANVSDWVHQVTTKHTNGNLILGLENYPVVYSLLAEIEELINKDPLETWEGLTKTTPPNPALQDFLRILTLTPYVGATESIIEGDSMSYDELMPERSKQSVTYKDYLKETTSLRSRISPVMADYFQKIPPNDPFFSEGIVNIQTLREGKMGDFLLELLIIGYRADLSNASQDENADPIDYVNSFITELRSYLENICTFSRFSNNYNHWNRLIQPLLIHFTLCFIHGLEASYSTQLKLVCLGTTLHINTSILTYRNSSAEREPRSENLPESDPKTTALEEAINHLERYLLKKRETPSLLCNSLENSKKTEMRDLVGELRTARTSNFQEMDLSQSIKAIEDRNNSLFKEHRYHAAVALIILGGFIFTFVLGIVFSIMASQKLGFFRAIREKRKKPHSQIAAETAINCLNSIVSHKTPTCG